MDGVEGQLHGQLDKGVRVELPLFDLSFSKGGEGTTHHLQVLSLWATSTQDNDRQCYC